MKILYSVPTIAWVPLAFPAIVISYVVVTAAVPEVVRTVFLALLRALHPQAVGAHFRLVRWPTGSLQSHRTRQPATGH